jgi:molecular chaperone GrpE
MTDHLKNKHTCRRIPIDDLENNESIPEEKITSETESASDAEIVDESQPVCPDIEAEAQMLRARLAEMTDNWQRERASFQNYRKRVEEEKKDVRRFACFDFASELIRVMDYFDSSVSFSENLPKEAESVVLGVKYTLAELTRVLATNGVEPIEVQIGQPFDSATMQAVDRKETDEAAADTVLTVQRRGWKCYDRILRPVQVIVAAAPKTILPDEGGENG